MDEEPHVPDWRRALDKAWQTRRCGAKTRAGGVCNGMAMPNGRCRFHGGKSTGPRTAEGLDRIVKARTVHGHRSAERIALRRLVAENVRRLRELSQVSRAMLRAVGR